MMTTTSSSVRGELQEICAEQLPEKLRGNGFVLAVVDFGSALLLLIIASIVHEARAAILSLTMLLAFASWSGRYRLSFATSPQDEFYATLAFAVPAALVVAIVMPLLETSVAGTLGTLFAWTALASAGAIVLCARRRDGSPKRAGTCYRVDHIGRARTRSLGVRGPIEIADFLLALLGLLVLSPVFIACSLAILRESGLPVLFRQRRVGINDREFVMFKFRTMRVDAGSDWATLPGDERITRVGRFLRRTSLDELPQFWNVVKGEMSLVGPRPEMCEYGDRFASEIADYSDRHLIPPGITGWAQLNYDRNFTPESARQVLAYDLFYARYRSLTLYSMCLVKTLCEVMNHRAV
jgi:lipopolysaccharide/colanic/teichoic acid biosynthesis glycosyltransferase